MNQVPAYLLFVYFIGDKAVDGPQTAREWKAAVSVAQGVLGLPARHRLSDYVADIFVHVGRLKGSETPWCLSPGRLARRLGFAL